VTSLIGSPPEAPAPVESVRVAMLGFGTVGTGVYRMLQDNAEAIRRKIGIPVEVVRIGIRDGAKSRSLPPDAFTTDLASVVDDPQVHVVLELMGGIEPAAALVERALRNGKHVVTANKELIAKDGSRLVHLARASGLDLHFEAAVGGGIPLVQPLKHQLAGNDVLKMMGILNGTTNYILTRMESADLEFDEALREARELGYAEADPSSDVDGYDSAYKIAILASIAFGRQVPVQGVFREGIRSLTKLDMRYADILGYTIKLLGIVEPAGEERVLARVHPTLVPKGHPLSSVAGVYNAVWFHGDFVGDVMFSGRGAGSDPTASAVVGDLVDVGRNLFHGGSGSAIPYDAGMETLPIEELQTRFYLRLTVQDRPRVLGAIATALGAHGVSLAAMEMKTLDEGRGEIVFLTHRAREASFRLALEELRASESVESVGQWLRVEE
jgi:homoserine dehydrogenase